MLVKDKLMTLNLDRRHAFVGDSGSTIKLVVATVEPKLSFAMDAKAPMHMPDSSSKVLLSPATLLFIYTVILLQMLLMTQPNPKFAINFPK